MARLKTSVVYIPRPETDSQAELDALASVHRFVLDCRAKKNPAADPSERGEDGTKPKGDSAYVSILPH